MKGTPLQLLNRGWIDNALFQPGGRGMGMENGRMNSTKSWEQKSLYLSIGVLLSTVHVKVLKLSDLFPCYFEIEKEEMKIWKKIVII